MALRRQRHKYIDKGIFIWDDISQQQELQGQ
jgi:hypothetical protein